jgi:signal peptidase
MTTETLSLPETHLPAAKSRLHRLYDATTSVMTVIVAAVGVLALIVAVMTRISSKQEYTMFGHPVMSVLSGSMSPAIKTGDLIIDSQMHSTAEARGLHVGQVITFRDPSAPSKVITHRIHAIETEGGAVTGYVTKGDANNAPDRVAVPPSNVIGVFDHKIPRGGYVLNALHKPQVLGLLIASPLLWLLSGWLIAYGRRPEEVDRS